MAVCAICGEKLGIFDRELCTDGFICKKCRSFFEESRVPSISKKIAFLLICPSFLIA